MGSSDTVCNSLGSVRRLFLVVALLAGASAAQQPASCSLPPFPRLDRSRNIFTEQQEIVLGDIIDEQVVKQYEVLEDPEGDYLQKFGDRILAQLPPTDVHYRFYLIDLPVNNAFSFGGSRIYVTRQLITFLHDDDELAGLLGHELGHIVTRQRGVEMTRIFHDVLNVNSVGDRNDILNKWNQVVDTVGRKPRIFGDEVEEDQLIADRVGLYAMMRAGYQPRRFADFFDRLANLKGHTGNFFTDLFGTTSPDSKRLRDLIDKAQPLDAACVSAPPSDSAKHFQAWQQKVLSATRVVNQEQVPGLLKKVALHPPLRGSMDYLQFSPDGNYLAAQDDSSIFVLSNSPLKHLFRIDALNAEWPRFSPDSRTVSFYDEELRVQTWDIASGQRTAIHEVVLPYSCRHKDLSPKGDVLACVRFDKDDYKLDLIDVATGQAFFTRTLNRRHPNTLTGSPLQQFYENFSFIYFSHFASDYSPDARYFVVGGDYIYPFGYDLTERKEVKLSGRFEDLTSWSFAFVGPHQLAGYNVSNASQSALVDFPSGNVLRTLPLEVNKFKLDGRFVAAPQSPYLLIAPAAMYSVAVIDLETGKVVFGTHTPAFAIFRDTIASEEMSGRLALYNLSDKQRRGGLQLPQSPLPDVRSFTFSSDGKWLAAAGRTSGGIWDAASGELVFNTGAFQGSFFDNNQFLGVFDNPNEGPKVTQWDLGTKSHSDLYSLASRNPRDPKGEKNDRAQQEHVWQVGNMVFTQITHATVGLYGEESTVEARDIRTNKVAWSHKYSKYPPKYFFFPADGTLSLVFDLYDNFKDEIKDDPKMVERLNSFPDNKYSNFVQVVDAATGRKLGGVIVDTGKLSFFVREAIAAHDTVLVYDTHNRTHIYSLQSGTMRGRLNGRFQAITPAGDRFLVENSPGECDLVDATTLQPLNHLTFPSRIAQAQFSGDGATLYVLTADQNIWMVKNPATAASNVAAH